MIDFFLGILALAYITVASIQDLKRREVWNWLNFSLITFAIAYRAFFAVFFSDWRFFVYGLLGLILFVVLGYAFYYARIFAGGDAKLLMALGAVLPLSGSLFDNFFVFGVFIILLLFAGSAYGLVYSFVLVFRNRNRFAVEFKSKFRKYKKIHCFAVAVALMLAFFALVFLDFLFLLFPLLILLLPLLYVYGKSVEDSCMIQEIAAIKLSEGDWLYEKVRIGKKVIKPYWEGLSNEEIDLLKKHKKRVKIKVGIPFVPAFLIAFLILIYLLYSGMVFEYFLFWVD